MHLGYMGSHGFQKGPLDPANHAECEAKLRAGIDLAERFGCKNVITFTGYRVKGIADEQASRNCVEFWKRLMPYAESKGVNLALEMLNMRDSTHPMKGHPGYYGNDVDLCVDLIKQVGSPRMRLLFDVYHVQIMNGDVIRRIRQHKDYIAHVHVAGVPGRGELDGTQELNYPAVMRALIEVGYDGFVARSSSRRGRTRSRHYGTPFGSATSDSCAFVPSYHRRASSSIAKAYRRQMSFHSTFEVGRGTIVVGNDPSAWEDVLHFCFEPENGPAIAGRTLDVLPARVVSIGKDRYSYRRIRDRCEPEHYPRTT